MHPTISKTWGKVTNVGASKRKLRFWRSLVIKKNLSFEPKQRVKYIKDLKEESEKNRQSDQQRLLNNYTKQKKLTTKPKKRGGGGAGGGKTGISPTIGMSVPGGVLVLVERHKSIVVLVVELHVPLGPVHRLPRRLLEVPLHQLIGTHEPIARAHIDLGEEKNDAVGDIEALVVIDVVLHVHEVLPLGPGLPLAVVVGDGEVLPLPLLVLAVDLDVGDDRIEGNRRVVVAAAVDGGVGAEDEATVGSVAVGGICRREERGEENEQEES